MRSTSFLKQWQREPSSQVFFFPRVERKHTCAGKSEQEAQVLQAAAFLDHHQVYQTVAAVAISGSSRQEQGKI